MLELAAKLFQVYSIIVLTVLLIKMFTLSMKKETQRVGTLGIVFLLPIFLFVVNVVI